MTSDPLRPVYGRAPADVKASAVKALAEAPGDWTMDAFLVACLVTLGTEPAEILALVAPHRLEPRPTGRPRKSASEPVKSAPKRATRKPASKKAAVPVEPVSFVAATEPEPERLIPGVRPIARLPFKPSPKPSQKGKRG